MDLHWHKVGAELGTSPIERIREFFVQGLTGEEDEEKGQCGECTKHLNANVKSL